MCCQKDKRISHIGNLQRNEQAAKSNRTLNVNNSQPRDLTAYRAIITLTRGRSFHSSISSNTKGSSLNSLVGKTGDNSRLEKSIKSDKPEWVSGRVDAVTVVKRLLEQKSLKGHKLYNLIGILADPYFLEKCYSEIRSKPGNMTKGTTNETLDRIN